MSMFADAKTVNDAPAKKKADKKAEFTIPGLANYARVTAAIETLSTMAAALKADVNRVAMDTFVTLGGKTGIRPENFRGVEVVGNNRATSSMELRLRGGGSPVSIEEKKILDTAKIPTTREVAIQAMFGFNQKYTNNIELLGKIEAALKPVLSAEVMEDLIVKQEERSKDVVTKESVDEVFKLLALATEKLSTAKSATAKAAAKAEHEHVLTLLRMVTVQAVKPSTDEDIGAVMAAIVPMVMPKPVEVTDKVGA